MNYKINVRGSWIAVRDKADAKRLLAQMVKRSQCRLDQVPAALASYTLRG